MRWPGSSGDASPSLLWLAIPYLAFGIGMVGFGNAWLALVLYHIGIGIFLFCLRQQWRLQNLREGLRPLWSAAAVLAPSLLVLPLVWLGQSKDFTGEKVGGILDAFGLSGLSAPLFIAYFVLINPPLEELFWRRFFFVPNRGIASRDLLFGGFHFVILYPVLPPTYCLIGVGMITAIGWAWRSLTRVSHGIGLPILSHLAADAAISAVTVILVYS